MHLLLSQPHTGPDQRCAEFGHRSCRCSASRTRSSASSPRFSWNQTAAEAQRLFSLSCRHSASIRPTLRPKGLVVIGAKPTAKKEAAPQEVVTRVSTSGGRHWGVNVGRFGSRYAAEKVLIKTALAEMATLDGSLAKLFANRRALTLTSSA